MKLIDGFANLLKGLGGGKDARMYSDFRPGLRVEKRLAENLFTYNWLAAKVITAPVDDALRKWVSIQSEDAEEKKRIENLLLKYGIKELVYRVFVWGRLFGGAALVPIIENGEQTEPLDIEKIKPGQLKTIILKDRYHLTAGTLDRDIFSTNYDKPVSFSLVDNGTVFHYSRVLRVNGKTATEDEMRNLSGWGLSVLTDIIEPLYDALGVSASISNLIYESNVDVYKIKDFNSLLAENSEDLATKRLEYANKFKSTINAIALDSEDSYDKKTNTFTNLENLDDRAYQKVAGASGIPVTKLIGISPSGMNATGESDLNNYNDLVQTLQENKIRPVLTDLLTIICLNEGITTIPEFVFNPLKQMTEVEKADVSLKRSQRDMNYLRENVIEPTDVMSQLAEDKTYVSINAQRVEEEKEALELGGFDE
jgi:phage-related protein (TIGR01555 family)